MDTTFPNEIDGVKILKFLGKGRGGYSYLVNYSSREAVLKKMHYEKCDVYNFPPDKLKAEIRDYTTLSKLQLPIPRLLYYSREKQYLIKEYIDGPTCAELVARGRLPDFCYDQIKIMCKALYDNKLNIDFMPHNFALKGSQLYYIDYECNQYSAEWDFEHWGVFFWVNKNGMRKQLRTGDHRFLSRDGKPLINRRLKKRLRMYFQDLISLFLMATFMIKLLFTG